jgi:hypothetical protein
MRIQMNATHGKHVLVGLAAFVGLAGAAACLSSDDTPAGGRVVHPPRASVLSAEQAQDGGPSGEQFSPLDHAIANDCSAGFRSGNRPWSKNVPDRDCTRDDECGDGFCDRGRCAAIRTCDDRYGQRCVNGLPAPNRYGHYRCWGICLDGRCRSCQSDAECVVDSGYSGAVCDSYRGEHGRGCGMPGLTINRPVNRPPPSQ